MKKAVLLLFITIFSLNIFAQKDSDERLAIQYYQNKEYEKAAELFKKCYDKKSDLYIYSYYYQTLLELQRYKDLEKVVKKQQQVLPSSQRVKVDLAYVYERSGQTDKAQKEYQRALNELPARENAIKELYNAFLVRGQKEYAADALVKGRKLLKNNKLFSKELTRIYIQMNQPAKVIDEALALVADNDVTYLDDAEAIIQDLLADDDDQQDYLTLKSVLQRNTQKEPNNNCYMYLLYWLNLIHKDYDAALVMAKSMDKRYKEDGERVFKLAQVMSENRNYDGAIEALNYVIDKGSKYDYYTSAKYELLNVKYKKLTSTYPVRMADAMNLESEFRKLLNEYGLHSGTSEWVRKYAHLLAFYVNKSEQATEILNNAIVAAGRDAREKALYKIDLADIQLFTGDIWEATLNYSQVEKDLPNDTIGHLAKFKNAKLSFYIGEFEWAKNQLDVLSAATSKYIANDALYFSLLISDNEEDKEEEDTTTTSLFGGQQADNQPLRYYAKADFLIFQNKDDEAMQYLDSVLLVSPLDKLADDVYFQKAKLLIKKKDYLGAESLLQKILTRYGEDILADDAAFALAELYDYYLKDIPKAMECYQTLMRDYPSSVFVVDARKRYRELRGDFN
ncbi:MAG: tetratricopeptide repeat protein [Bacteroidales bacterium]|nr:tetratricopeptide repeat protein [Bacteroidales bacterium]